jgi:glycosyltransferase involved in cell wall biosynthesis
MTTPGNRPVVSVSVSTYNRAHLLGRALRSVLAQTFQDYEIIVVDDGSTDNTEEVVRSFGDARIQYLRHESNRGQSAAINTGIRAATGEYVAFLDDDDEWLPEKLAIQLETFKTSDLERLGVVSCPKLTVYDGRRKVRAPRKRRFARGWVHKDLLARRMVVPWATCSLLVRRDALTEANLFDESLPHSKDWDFVFRLSRDWQIQAVETPLIRVHYHSGPSIGRSGKDLEAAERIIAKYHSEFLAEPAILAHSYYRLAWRYFRAGETAKCRQNLKNTLRYHRWHLGARLLQGLTLLPTNGLPKTYMGMKRMKQRLRWLKY